jgi:uncharacterized membrane protein YecN with MAPEG domain
MVTGLYAGVLALMFVILSVRVVLLRIKNRLSYGDGGIPALTHAIRIHGNFAEYVPFALVLMALYEMQAGSMYLLHAFGIILVIARIAHIFGLQKGVLAGRSGGTILTMSVIVVVGVLLILKGIRLLQVV